MLRTNDEVLTPLAMRGVVQGEMNGQALVRVIVSGSATDSRCVTPLAKKSSLWLFPFEELACPN